MLSLSAVTFGWLVFSFSVVKSGWFEQKWTGVACDEEDLVDVGRGEYDDDDDDDDDKVR